MFPGWILSCLIPLAFRFSSEIFLQASGFLIGSTTIGYKAAEIVPTMAPKNAAYRQPFNLIPLLYDIFFVGFERAVQ